MADGSILLAPVETEQLRIVAFEERHLTQAYVDWLNDKQVVRYSEQRHHTHTLGTCEAYFESFRAGPNLFLAIETRDGGVHVGNISVAVDPPNGVADISILIGDRTAWGQGYGYEAWCGVMNALLEEPRIRKVTGGAAETNTAMVSIMRNSGMVEDGRRCGHLHMDGEFIDVVYFAAFSGINYSAD